MKKKYTVVLLNIKNIININSNSSKKFFLSSLRGSLDQTTSSFRPYYLLLFLYFYQIFKVALKKLNELHLKNLRDISRT